MVILFDGIAYGMLLYLMSVGLSVTMGLMGFVNLAHGVFAMFGGYLAIVLQQYTGLNFLLLLPLVFLLTALLGAVLEVVLFRRLYGANPLAHVLLSVGVVFVAVTIATFTFGPSVLSIQTPHNLQGQVSLAGITIGKYRLFLVCVGLLLSVLLWVGITKTQYGARLRAAVNNLRVAAALGINVNRIFLCTFALGSGLAGLGGVLSLDLLGIEPNFALKYMVYFLLIVSLGGAGTLLGPFLAAILVGVIDTVGKYYVPELGGFLIYFVMLIVLLVRPNGLIAAKGITSTGT